MSGEALPRPSDKWIPWYIVLFFVVLSFVFGGFTYVALKTHTGLVTDNAYKKGIAYNETINKDRQQKALGYKAHLTYSDDTVIFSLVDKAGIPVEISSASIWFFRPTNAKSDLRAEMTAADTGRFEYAAAAPPAGLWEVRILAETAAGPYQYAKRRVFE
ncbi:MAG: FixH family protein [Alphaproteobacteria bacterium]|nr:FixH family protein [Alphaproteobacteria bacterium]